MLELENCPAARPEWFWLKCVLSCMLQSLKILPLDRFLLLMLLGSLNPVRASEVRDPAAKWVKVLWVAESFGLHSVKGGAENPAFSSWCIWWLKVWHSGIGFLLNFRGSMLRSAHFTSLVVYWTSMVFLLLHRLGLIIYLHLPLFSSVML